MHLIHELLISGLIVLGAIFALVGSYGMLKFPDLMTRLHAPTKATTLGVGGVGGFNGVFPHLGRPCLYP